MAIETVFPMMGGLLAAWLSMPYRLEWVFAMARIAAGAHYFGFRSAQGDWTNWVLGGTMCAVGLAAIEVVFGASLDWISLAKDPLQSSA